MDYQFIHIDAVSKNKRDLYRKVNGKKITVGYMSIDSVLGEAERKEGFCKHVKNPLPPVIIFDDNNINSFEKLREYLNKWYIETTDSRGHKVRINAIALLSGVVSFPPIGDNEDIKDYMKRLVSFEDALIKWLKKKYKEDLFLIIRHEDEPFKGKNAGKIRYHWHFFCMKKPCEKFDLHPGFLERSKYDISRKERKNLKKEEITKKYFKGINAYRDKMIEFQDEFHFELGRFHGLERKGPMRLRRSRS